MGQMLDDYPKHAVIDGKEAVFIEAAHHVYNDTVVVIFQNCCGDRRFATADEWRAGAATEQTGMKGARATAATVEQAIGVSSSSPSREKLALFRSLFKGRADSYAHGYRKSTGGIGYAPVCSNKWKSGGVSQSGEQACKVREMRCASIGPVG